MTRTTDSRTSDNGADRRLDDHALAELATDLLLVIEPDGRLRYANRAAIRILGHEPRDFIGRNVLDLVHPDDKSRAVRALESSTEASGTQEAPLRLRGTHADGTWRWLELVANNLLDDDRVRGIVISARDVTDRVDAERALRESEERFRQIVEHASEGIWTIDGNGITTFVNPRMAEMLGYSIEDMLGKSLYQFMDDDGRRDAEAKQARRRQGISERHEFRFIRKDGRDLWALLSATPLLDADGAYVGSLALCTDLTDRREAEREVRASEQRMRALLRHSADIITVLNADGSWRFSSAATGDVLGHPAEARNQPLPEMLSYVHPQDVETTTQQFRELMSSPGGTVQTQLVRCRAADGSWRQLEVVRRNLVDDPNINGFVINSRDVTDRVEAETALREQEKWFAALAQHSSDMVTVMDAQGVITYISPSVRSVLGYTPDELVGTQARDLVHPDDIEHVEQSVVEQSAVGIALPCVEYRVRHRDGSYRIVEGITDILLDEPSVHGVVNNVRDITERRAAEARAHQLEEVLAKSNEVVLLSDNEGNVVWANQKARSWLGLTGDQHVSELSTLESRERLRNDIMPFVRKHGLWTGELTLLTSAGEEIPVVATLQVHRDEGDIVLVSTIAHDITELKQIQHRLRYEATHDPLTGLPNRSLFRELGEQALARAARHGSSTAVLFLDLDGFKVVNDTLGHTVGDNVLVEMSARLRVGVRSGDVIARLGGDEFCVLCERVAGLEEAEELARRLVGVVSIPMTISGRSFGLGVSIGVAIDDSGETTIAKLIRNADVALYRAKEGGPDHVACFDALRD